VDKEAKVKEKVLIVGGGLAGLTAANFLAQAGREVTLFEKSHALGGRAATTSRNGIHFNLGPHALYRAGQAYRFLSELGVEFHGAFPKADGSLAIDGGQKHTLPSGALTLLATSLFGLSAKFEAARLLTTLPKVNAETINHLTVREWLDKEFRHPDVRRLVQAFFRLGTYTNDPERQSAGSALAQFQMALKEAVIYLDGGWQTLVEGLRDKARQAGVKIHSGARVAKIERNAQTGHVLGVQLAEGAMYAADSVIVAASPKEVCDLVTNSENTVLNEWAKRAIPVKAACLDIALKRLPRPQTNFALGIDRPLYLSVHSATAKLAPAGNAVIHMAMYLESGNKADPKAIQHDLEELLDLVQPGWQSLVLERRFLPSMTVSNALTTAEQGGNQGRPGPEVPGIEGLYVAGDWVGTEGLLADASVASGKRAAELVTNKMINRIAAAA
jgi:phytoene dehydrogenase-like protein